MPDRPELKKVDVASGFSLLWEHSCRAAGRRTRELRAPTDFRPFFKVWFRFKVPSSSLLAPASRSAEPKSDAALVQGATDGRHGRCRAKGCPQIGSLQRYTTSAGPCSPRDAGGYQQKTSSARAYSSAATAPQHLIASAAMPVRRGARPGREHRHRTRDVRTACAFWMRGDASRRGPAPALWVLQASTRSRRARARVRVRVSQGPPLPRPVFRYTTGRAGRLGGARHTN